MLNSTRRALVYLLVAAGVTGSAIAVASSDERERIVDTVAISNAVLSNYRSDAALQRSSGLKGFDPRKFHFYNNQAVVDLPNSRQAILSLDVGLQQHIERFLDRYEVPFGAVVAMEPATGRVLSYVSHSSVSSSTKDWVLDSSPPSASVFKIVTAAALIDAGVDPEERICYSGGFRRLTLSNLLDRPRRDRHCASFQEAMGSSINTVFAKLSDRHLTPEILERYASAFGFGHALPFDIPTRPSKLRIPKDRIEFVRAASGFWHLYMSPLHGAYIASIIANEGVMQRATMVDRFLDSDGNALYQFQPTMFRSVISRYTAKLVGQMMIQTVTHGTARRAFYDLNRNPFLPGVEVAGKTGSLTKPKPFQAYSWWVGYAPVEKPTISVAALVINTPHWRIKGSHVAREALRYYLIQKNSP